VHVLLFSRPLFYGNFTVLSIRIQTFTILIKQHHPFSVPRDALNTGRSSASNINKSKTLFSVTGLAGTSQVWAGGSTSPLHRPLCNAIVNPGVSFQVIIVDIPYLYSLYSLDNDCPSIQYGSRSRVEFQNLLLTPPKHDYFSVHGFFFKQPCAALMNRAQER
jgi:hypothetical protein